MDTLRTTTPINIHARWNTELTGLASRRPAEYLRCHAAAEGHARVFLCVCIYIYVHVICARNWRNLLTGTGAAHQNTRTYTGEVPLARCASLRPHRTHTHTHVSVQLSAYPRANAAAAATGARCIRERAHIICENGDAAPGCRIEFHRARQNEIHAGSIASARQRRSNVHYQVAHISGAARSSRGAAALPVVLRVACAAVLVHKSENDPIKITPSVRLQLQAAREAHAGKHGEAEVSTTRFYAQRHSCTTYIIPHLYGGGEIWPDAAAHRSSGSCNASSARKVLQTAQSAACSFTMLLSTAF